MSVPPSSTTHPRPPSCWCLFQVRSRCLIVHRYHPPPPPTPARPRVVFVSRLEVAQRMREMKLMTQPGVGPLAPVTRAAAGAASLTEALPSNKLEGDAAALEHQISLLSARITSIANHLKVNEDYCLKATPGPAAPPVSGETRRSLT